MTSAKISVIPEFEQVIISRNSQDFFDSSNNQIINKLTGSTINFKGLKTGALTQTAQLKSVTNLNIWLLDEAEELTDENVFDDVDESIRRQGYENIIVLLLNTYRITKDHFIYKRFFEDKGIFEDYYNGVKDNVLYIHTDYLDNVENLSESFLNIVEDTKNKKLEKYEYRYLGKFRNRPEGVIFDDWEIGEFDNSLPFRFGLDFGFHPDPDAMARVAIDKKRKIIYCDECFYKTNQSVDNLKDNISNYAKRNNLIIAESANPRLISELRPKFNIKPVSKGSNSVKEGIRLMQDYKIVVTKDSLNLQKELNNYAWDDKKAGIPIDEYNHLIDAIRYVVWMALRRVRTL
jgi:phage terminase large subunit